MPLQVIIVQTESTSIQLLTNLFSGRGDQIQCATTPAEVLSLMEQVQPCLLVIDLHMVENGWHQLLQQIPHRFPHTKLLFTTNYPDPQQELQARKRYGASGFLQQPFTRTELERVLRDLEEETAITPNSATAQASRPKVRVPVRIKITLPYVLLALFLALGAAYVVSQVVLDTIEERFTNQLIEAGKLANDWMVMEEDRLLETLRLVAHNKEIPEAVVAGDAEQLRELTLPLAVNYQEEAIEILGTQGVSLLSLRHKNNGPMEDYDASQGDTIFNQWAFVQDVLEQRSDRGGDKYAGLARAPWGDYLYVAGPIFDEEGNRVGIVMIGKSLPTVVHQIREATLAHVTIYDLNGQPMATTFEFFEQDLEALSSELVSDILERQGDSLMRPLAVASINYSEIVGPWEVREFLEPMDMPHSGNELGLVGVAIAETFLARPSQITRVQIFLFTAVAFVLVIALGVSLANRITRPLLRIVDASAEVAQGKLDVQVEAAGDDEIAVLAHSFNQMVSGLREGSIYRDLLGRTVSPEVREQLRRGFASGELRLEGQDAVATVLMSDIRGFTTLSETEDPTTIMTWLNEYFEELVPLITSHGGVISKFEGDAVLAFFGILPRSLPPQESAYQACRAALAMLDAIERLNARRAARGDSLFAVGIGTNTGPVTAGGLGSNDRLHYTIIGDTVNATARLENLTRQFGQESSAVISQHTLFALRDQRHEFRLESLGAHTVKGKTEQLLVYRLQAAKVTA